MRHPNKETVHLAPEFPATKKKETLPLKTVLMSFCTQIVHKCPDLFSTAVTKREKCSEQHVSFYCKLSIEDQSCSDHTQTCTPQEAGVGVWPENSGKTFSFIEVNKCFLHAMEIYLQRNKSLETKFSLRQLQPSTRCLLYRWA